MKKTFLIALAIVIFAGLFSSCKKELPYYSWKECEDPNGGHCILVNSQFAEDSSYIFVVKDKYGLGFEFQGEMVEYITTPFQARTQNYSCIHKKYKEEFYVTGDTIFLFKYIGIKEYSELHEFQDEDDFQFLKKIKP